MIEVIDRKTAQKMTAMIICEISYQNDCYLIYCVRRNKEEANIFISKLIKGSLGYVIDSNFLNGEKEVLDTIVKRLISRESKGSLANDGFIFMQNINMDNNLTFDIDECYVSTVDRNVIKECLVFYGLLNENIFSQPVIEIVDDRRKFSEGFASSIILIVLGIAILIFSCVVIYGVIFG